jgi:hypothetical protein
MTLIVADRLTYVLAFVVMELRPLEHKPKLFRKPRLPYKTFQGDIMKQRQ